MEKSLNFIVLILFLISSSLSAQEKLKGNKDVTTENRAISEFTKIEVIDNVSVLLVYNENQSVGVETDSNLQYAVLTEVNDGVLTIKTSAKIVRKKELTIHIKVNSNLKEINAYNSANVISKNSLIIDTLTINAFDNADFNLKLNSKIVHINGKRISKLQLEVLSDETFIRAEESCRINAIIDTKNININVLDRAIINMMGTSDAIELETFGTSSFKGKEFETKNAIVNATHNSDIYINAIESLDIFAKNSADVYIYSNPKMTISEFFDKASLHKKELN